MKKLRIGSDSVIGGVCSGLAEYVGIDMIWIRILFMSLAFFTEFPIVLIYIVLWIILPPSS